jgi:hypothetical protein
MPPSHLLKIHFDIILPSTPGSPKWWLSLKSPYQNPVCTSPLPNTCHIPAHLILLDLITRTIFGDEYRWSPSLCSLLHSPVTSSLLGPNYLSIKIDFTTGFLNYFLWIIAGFLWLNGYSFWCKDFRQENGYMGDHIWTDTTDISIITSSVKASQYE